jgi:heat shock protein 4
MRDKIASESHLAPYSTVKERESMSAALESIENWLYEDGFDATKSVYAEKLKELKKIGDPILFRQSEALNRPNAISSLQRTIEKYQSWCTTSQGVADFAHITTAEFDKCFKKCDETSAWMYDVLDKQGSRTLCDTPVTTVAEIDAKVKDLTTVVNPIMYKPKPKPSAEEKKPEDKATETPNTNGEQQPMDTDEKTTGGPEPMDTQ